MVTNGSGLGWWFGIPGGAPKQQSTLNPFQTIICSSNCVLSQKFFMGNPQSNEHLKQLNSGMS